MPRRDRRGGAGDAVTVSNTTISDNERSGVLVGLRATATLSSSTLTRNAVGVSVNTATLVIRDRSTVADNSSDGIWFNLPTTTPLPAASSITASDITRNGRYGVYLGANGEYPLASLPTATGSNIYGNLDSSGPQLHVSGYPSFKNANVNWRGNYWGDDVYFYENPSECGSVAPYSPGRPVYRASSASPPSGPLGGGTYSISKPFPQPSVTCAFAPFDTRQCGLSSTYVGDSGQTLVAFETPVPVAGALT